MDNQRKHIILIPQKGQLAFTQATEIVTKRFNMAKVFRMSSYHSDFPFQFMDIPKDVECIWMCRVMKADIFNAFALAENDLIITPRNEDKYIIAPTFFYVMDEGIELKDLPGRCKNPTRFEIIDLNTTFMHPEIQFGNFATVPTVLALDIVFNLPPFQMPPIYKTKNEQFEISLEIVGITIYVLETNWHDALVNYASQIKVYQSHPQMRKVFYNKDGTLKPRKS